MEDKSENVTKSRPKSFEELASAAGLKEASLSKMAEQDVGSTLAVKALHGEDCQTFGLSLGQVRCLQRWRESLLTPTGEKKGQKVVKTSGSVENA